MRKMIGSSHAWFLLILVSGILTGNAAYPQQEEYKEYTVQKGDTLWDISTKEIVDPFLWPKVWKENPEIKNPDLIYPGQKILIPLYLLQKQVFPQAERPMPIPEVKLPVPKEEKPVVTEIKPVKKDYLIDREGLISSGYIADSIQSKGKVIGSPTERELLGKGDYAYIEAAVPVNRGDKFYIIRSMGKVKHPETGKNMGYLIDVRGIAEVVGKESGETKIAITSSFGDVLVGDLLSDYYEVEPPFLTGNPRTPDIPGYIVATKHRRVLNGYMDFVHIDKGRKDGIEIGDILGMTARAKYNVPNGSIQIIHTKESTATAIVRISGKEVSVGDTIGTYAAVQ